MRASFRLGKVFGVPVAVHWSVLIIFGLIAWSVGGSILPRAYPGHSFWAYLIAGVSAAVVFFLGLLAHEVSHAVLAKRNGLEVNRITLWLLGGVAELHGEPRTAGADLRIAGVGPLVSLIIGLVFGGVAAALGLSGQRGLVFGTFAWLAGINLLLAGFNLLPAAPLDGGRLLRAALWKWRGDRVWAAVIAARVGRFLGFALIAVGVWQFIVGAGFGGLWLALIGWFLTGAARAEERQAQTGGALAGVRARDVMTEHPQTVPPDVSVADFVDHYLFAYRHSTFPLTEDDRPVGLATLDRIRQVPADRRHDTALRQVACRPEELVLVSPEEPVVNLLPRLNGCADGRVLVVSDGHLVGIVSPSDISRAVERRMPV
jgi:Zn-dependent protease/predicted transcriptional regulator